ncbi:MAG TPA: ABC transporter permease [Vicinamibacterales bacterium]|nr:ABC transporter permease [Vicinamibacterales bacterium]
MGHLRRDIQHTLRSWRRQPGAVVAAIAAIALGIAANTTVFSFVSAILLEPLPYGQPDRIVTVWQDLSARGGPARDVISPGLFVEWSKRTGPVFDAIGVLRPWGAVLTGLDEPERLQGAAVSAGYFKAVGVPPAIGRSFNDDDDRPGSAAVAMISHGLWVRRFLADPGVVGRTFQIDNQPTVIVGVMPAEFVAPILDAEIWSPARIDPENAPFGVVMLRAIALRKAEVSLPQAQQAMNTIARQIRSLDPDLEGAGVRVIGLQDDLVGPVRPALVVLWGSVGLVLLIAVANVTSLLLARATDRAREMSVRIALGADRRRLTMQMLTESACLAAGGGVAGILLAYGGVQSLVALAPTDLPRLAEVGLDARVLVFTIAITALTAVGAGLIPAATIVRGTLAATLKDGGREQTSASWPRTLLVVGEVAAALVLVVGAAMLVRSLMALQRVDLGFRTERVLTASIAPARGTYRGEEAIRGLLTQLVETARRLPGVTGASMTSVLPLSGMRLSFSFQIVGRPSTGRPNDDPVCAFRAVGRDYFSTMAMRIVEGRGLTAEDRADAPASAVVNESLAKRYWPNESPVGQGIVLNGAPATIVGIVADVHHAGPAAPPESELYMSFEQFSVRSGWLVMTTAGDPAAIAPSLRQAVRAIDPNLPVAAVRPLDQLAARTTAQTRFLTSLLTGFAVVAATLALVGVYGLIAFAVSRRVREVGLRMALGASRLSVVGLIMRQSAIAVAIGLALGAGLAAGLSSSLRALLFEVAPGDPWTIAAMACLIALAALIASAIPARRAATIDPTVALRED